MGLIGFACKTLQVLGGVEKIQYLKLNARPNDVRRKLVYNKLSTILIMMVLGVYRSINHAEWASLRPELPANRLFVNHSIWLITKHPLNSALLSLCEGHPPWCLTLRVISVKMLAGRLWDDPPVTNGSPPPPPPPKGPNIAESLCMPCSHHGMRLLVGLSVRLPENNYRGKSGITR